LKIVEFSNFDSTFTIFFFFKQTAIASLSTFFKYPLCYLSSSQSL